MFDGKMSKLTTKTVLLVTPIFTNAYVVNQCNHCLKTGPPCFRSKNFNCPAKEQNILLQILVSSESFYNFPTLLDFSTFPGLRQELCW